MNYPQTSTIFIDRFLATAEAYSVPTVLVFNKTDILSDEERHYQEMMMRLYETVGYKCVAVSATTGLGMDAIPPMLKDKKTLLSGNSGVGKSTFINHILPGANLRTSEISDAHNTGMHTTTFSEMLELPEGGYLIDTPGIKGFGTFDMEPEELTSYFKDIFHFSKECRFNNCKHTHEPGCAVLKAVSATTGLGMDAIPPMLKDKKTLLSGNSGVGKSTFINHILPGANLRTSEISDAHNTGMHTTTFSEMLELPEGGYLIDTPGIKGFGTFDMEPEELTSYFKDIFHFSKECRFNNCTHTHEPGCAVLKAVEEHYIAASRYQSYLSMLEDKDENKYREAY